VPAWRARSPAAAARAGAGPAHPAIDQQGFRWPTRARCARATWLAPETTGSDLSALDEARGFLRSLLGAGPVATNEVWAAARRAGIAEHTLRRAKELEGIVARRQGYGLGGSWRRSLDGAPASPDGEA
jgi:hypothetical protein